jgi:two-component system chemotaxis response regulator CheY
MVSTMEAMALSDSAREFSPMKYCLVVDDSRVIRKVARRIMEELRYSVEEAEDGMAGLCACHEKMPDLIFLDWNLPSMKGLDFVKSVRGQPHGAHPVILFCTTESDPGEIASAMAAGANEYVMKPFDGSHVRAKLAEIGVAP